MPHAALISASRSSLLSTAALSHLRSEFLHVIGYHINPVTSTSNQCSGDSCVIFIDSNFCLIILKSWLYAGWYSLCWWKHLSGHTTKSMESNIWCGSHSDLYTGRLLDRIYLKQVYAVAISVHMWIMSKLFRSVDVSVFCTDDLITQIACRWHAVASVWSEPQLTSELGSSSNVQWKSKRIQSQGARDCRAELDCRIITSCVGYPQHGDIHCPWHVELSMVRSEIVGSF